MKVYHPWSIDESAERWKWGIGYLHLRGISVDSTFLVEPASDRTISQIEWLVRWARGSRRWIVCISPSASYMRKLFHYVMVSYVLTTGLRAIVVDIDDLTEAVDNPDGDKRDIIEYADLLLVNHCDPNNPHLKFKKGAIANIFQRRRFHQLATLLHLFVPALPEKVDAARAIEITRGVVDIFGETVYELFTDGVSKRAVIRVEGRRIGSEKRSAIS